MYSLFLCSVSLFLVAPSLVLGQPNPTQKCYTAYGTQVVSVVPTTTKTVHIDVPKTIIRNSHPQTTVTPSTTSTETITSTETDTVTASQNTDTATDTEYSTVTSTTTLGDVTIDQTSTITETSTSIYSGTSTVATPAGFTPVLDTLPNSEMRKRQANGRGGSLAAVRSKRPTSLGFSVKKYPAKIICVDFKYHTTLTHITHSQSGTVVKTAPTTATIVETTTETDTTTTTIYPTDASTTVTTTISDTSTITQGPTTTITNISTTTATESVVIVTQISYAACDPNTSRNFAGGINGDGIFMAYGLPNSTVSYGAAVSPADCCTQCITMGNICASSTWLVKETSPDKQCALDISQVGPQSGHTCVVPDSSVSTDQALIVSSGPQNPITDDCSYLG